MLVLSEAVLVLVLVLVGARIEYEYEYEYEHDHDENLSASPKTLCRIDLPVSDVTVLMAIYNAMPHLPAAVESIRAQTVPDWRMVVVNDGSSDGSVDYLQSLSDPRIEIVHQANAGLGPALNRGLEHCHTKYVARMDGDDVSLPTRLAEQIAYMEEHPEVGLLGTQIERMGSRRSAGQSSLATDHQRIDADIVRGRNQMYHPTIVCRTELVKQVGGYWNHPRGEEWDFFLRMGEVTRLANLDRVLLRYRVHDGSMTGTSVAEMRTWIEFACESARRRRQQLPALEYDEFVQQLASASLPSRVARRCELHARNQYRIGVGEMLGDHPTRGRLRLAYSAIWSPTLSWERAKRIFRQHLATKLANPAVSRVSTANSLGSRA